MAITGAHGQVRQAVILAGGQATRLRPYTDDRPKAMVPVADKAILDWQLEWLAAQGCENVVVSCGYLADVLAKHLADHSYPMQIEVAVETEPLGRGGALKFAAQHLPRRDERWLALNGDVLCRFPLADLLDRHLTAGATATIALAQYRTNWGIATLDEKDLIVGFVQSPSLPYWINGGIYAFEPELYDLLPDKGDHEDSTFPRLAVDKKLAGFKIDGFWMGIDTVKDVKEATAIVTRGDW